MKHFFIPMIASFIFPLALLVGCDHMNNPTSSGGYGGGYGGGGGGTPTPTSAYTISAVSTASGYRYSTGGTSGTALSAPLTIMHGQSITWDTSNGGIHPLDLDNGSTCITSPANTSFPYTYMFNTVGTYDFHCTNHGSCGSTCPSTSCSAMAGTIVVQ